MSQTPFSNDASLGTTSANQSMFRVQRLYLKDLSFESPNVPAVFREERKEPQLTLNIDTRTAKLDEENYEVALQITAKTVMGDKTLFLIEATYAGIFLLRNIQAQHIPMILGIECPSILFPYVRQIISQMVIDGGFPPLVLDPINFASLFQQAQQNAKNQGGVPPTNMPQ